MASTPGFEPEQRLWEASALTTAPPLTILPWIPLHRNNFFLDLASSTSTSWNIPAVTIVVTLCAFQESSFGGIPVLLFSCDILLTGQL